MKSYISISIVIMTLGLIFNEQKKIKKRTDYLNGKKIHERFYNKEGKPILHHYFKDENEIVTTSWERDTFNRVEIEKEYRTLTDRSKKLIESSYYHLEKKELIKQINHQRNETSFFDYEAKGDTIIQTTYLNKKNKKEGKWFSKSKHLELESKTIFLEDKVNEIYGGGGEKRKVIYDSLWNINKSIHFYLSYDTTFYKYNNLGQIEKTENQTRGAKNTSEFEYNENGDKKYWKIIRIDYAGKQESILEYEYEYY